MENKFGLGVNLIKEGRQHIYEAIFTSGDQILSMARGRTAKEAVLNTGICFGSMEVAVLLTAKVWWKDKQEPERKDCCIQHPDDLHLELLEKKLSSIKRMIAFLKMETHLVDLENPKQDNWNMIELADLEIKEFKVEQKIKKIHERN